MHAQKHSCTPNVVYPYIMFRLLYCYHVSQQDIVCQIKEVYTRKTNAKKKKKGRRRRKTIFDDRYCATSAR